MIRLIIFVIYLMTWIECHSQRIFIVDSIDKTPLAFVAVKYDKGGLYTNEKGWFNVDIIKGDIIELSLLGYKTKQIQTNRIKDTIYLSTEFTQLDEVIVLNRDNKNNIVYKKPKSTNFHGSTILMPKSEVHLVLIPDGLSSSIYIDDITFNFRKKLGLQNDTKEALKKVDGVIRINLYEVDNEKPVRQFYASQPIKISSFKKDETVLNLSNEHITIPKEGIGIGIEMIGYYDDVYTEVTNKTNLRPMLTPQKYKYFKAISYHRFSFNDDKLLLLSDFLKGFKDIKLEHTDRNLAIGLTLSEFTD